MYRDSPHVDMWNTLVPLSVGTLQHYLATKCKKHISGWWWAVQYTLVEIYFFVFFLNKWRKCFLKTWHKIRELLVALQVLADSPVVFRTIGSEKKITTTFCTHLLRKEIGATYRNVKWHWPEKERICLNGKFMWQWSKKETTFLYGNVTWQWLKKAYKSNSL